MALHCGHCNGTDVLDVTDHYVCQTCGQHTGYDGEPLPVNEARLADYEYLTNGPR